MVMRSGTRKTPGRPAQTPEGDGLDATLRRAAIINAALLKLSSLDLPGIDTQTYRAVIDSAIGVLESTQSALTVNLVERRLADSTREHLHAQNELFRSREEEFHATVTLLTDAVIHFKDTNTTFAEQVLDRSDRMAQITAIDDLRTIRTRLTQEIVGLREATVAKQQADAEQIAGLSTRVEALEARLAVAVAQANRDALTGLNNRAAWDQRMSELAVRLHNGDDTIAVALIDIDHFKQVNDTHGHAVGDRALMLFGDLCRQAFGQDDFVARYGGDEFSVILEAPTLEHAADHMERLISSMRRANEARVRQGEPPLTISAGLASGRAHTGVESLLKSADTALYAAKQAGRDRLVIAAG